ncbi:hypothetical protein SYJ56_21145 [Algoriphagus sp. D3-2-R+10]|uniref:hypothetical protein n=1 Tax=Algoriphagus aurantiacus TaxID=3103948 RepID=UPI002B365A04|nr:hypothetical protein [Algoriphagus sp. D3-2-R+10]MEB2777835.1 hypothetical protein [Algoriphagus sp. D3-2-R+10]
MNVEKRKQGESTILTINPSYKPTGIAVFVTLIFTGFIVIFTQSIEQIIKGNFNLFFTIVFGLFFWVAYFNFFNFYWAILGNKIVEINNDFIKHTKCVWFLRHSKKYRKTKIGEFKIVDSTNSFGAAGTAMFGFSNINVQYKYGRKKKMIGKQIDQEEAKLILTELKNKNYATKHYV